MMKRLLTILMVFITSTFLFASITIEEADELLVKNNPTIKSAQEAVVKASLDLKDSKANFSPTIDLSVSASYMTDPIIGPIIMESSDILSQMGLGSYADSASGYVTLYDGMEKSLYMGSLTLTQPLVTWGKLSKAVDLYENILSAQSLKKDDTVSLLKSELRIRLWSLKYLEDMRTLLDEALIISSSLVDKAKSGYENGMLLKQDYLNAQISALEIEVKKAEVEENYSSVLEGLRSLVGDYSLSLSDFVMPSDDSYLYKYMDSDIDEMNAKATGDDNNNIKALNNLLAAYSNQKTIAERSFYGIPDFALQAELNYTFSRLPFIENGWKQNNNSGLNLSIGFKTTLWDGGKVINNIDRASSNIRDTQSQIEGAKREIRNAVISNYNAMKKNSLTIDYQREKLNNLALEEENIALGINEGQYSETDMLKKRLERVEAESNLLASKIALVQNVYTLDYLLGADFSE